MKIILITWFIIFASVNGIYCQNVELQENFNNGFPSGWLRIEEDGQTPNPNLIYSFNEPWVIVEDSSSTDSAIVTTSYFTNVNPASRWLITPKVELLSFGNFLRFEAKSGDASYPDSLVVLLSNTGNQTSDFQDTVLHIEPVPSFWQTYSINLAELGWTGDSVYIAFKNYSTDGYLLYLDQIEITNEDPASDIEWKVDYQLYPNPATDVLNFEFPKNGDIQLTDISGSIVKSINDTKSGQITTQNIAPGVYFFEWIHSNSSVRKKIIIQ